MTIPVLADSTWNLNVIRYPDGSERNLKALSFNMFIGSRSISASDVCHVQGIADDDESGTYFVFLSNGKVDRKIDVIMGSDLGCGLTDYPEGLFNDLIQTEEFVLSDSALTLLGPKANFLFNRP